MKDRMGHLQWNEKTKNRRNGHFTVLTDGTKQNILNKHILLL